MLGSTSVANAQLVYNRERTGELSWLGEGSICGGSVSLAETGAEYYVVDLFQNAELAGVELSVLSDNLSRAAAPARGTARHMPGSQNFSENVSSVTRWARNPALRLSPLAYLRDTPANLPASVRTNHTFMSALTSW